MYLPTARRERITVRELPDETLVYDLDRNKAHCLNKTSALVWKHCDGRTTAAEMAAMLHRELKSPINTAVVELALEQLGRRHLLMEAPLPVAKSRSRRQMLKAAAVALLPVVMTVTAPKAAAAASVALGGPCTANGDCTDLGAVTSNCCNGVCVETFLNSQHCGTCNNRCTGGKTCTGYRCECPITQTDCSGTCATLSTDNNNCGTCGTVCPPGTSCQGGVCACPAGQMLCAGACVNTQTSNTHCGTCNNVCTAGFTCVNGVCMGIG